MHTQDSVSLRSVSEREGMWWCLGCGRGAKVLPMATCWPQVVERREWHPWPPSLISRQKGGGEWSLQV
jgi:hypothetical protein